MSLRRERDGVSGDGVSGDGVSGDDVTTPLVVAAAVIERDGAYLLTRRVEGTHLEGLWEFPGGKCEPGETLEACLTRELVEELRLDVRVVRKLLVVRHAYPGKLVELHFFACAASGHPDPQQGQECRWVPAGELGALPFPEADRELIAMLSRREGQEGSHGHEKRKGPEESGRYRQ